MVKIEEIKGKKVIAKNGMRIGEVEDVELDDNTWTVTKVDVKLTDEVAKLYGTKSGFMSKSVVPLPSNVVGPITGDDIVLKEQVTDINSLREQIETSRW
ncbi:MAG: PRC-barrel domain-containing protein [Candidatus Bathyarchaeota archaeon]|nr:PRC-barrel domain-containing protein [Candidatus Bathyarchaeota archaeon]